MRFVLLSLVLLAVPAGADPVSTQPSALPALRLVDPAGREFTSAELMARGVVVIATAPSLTQGDAQIAWSDAVHGTRRETDGPVVVMLEDMSQSWFRGIVMARMKESYHPGGALLVLLDEGGVTRKALGVPENATVAFAFAPGGKLVTVEKEKATVGRVQALLRAAAGVGPVLGSR